MSMAFIFRDRDDAAQQLAARLLAYRESRPLVLAIPRGAVPMGKTLARLLGGDLDVVLVHKLQAPGQPELAIGAVDETGWSIVAPYAADVGANATYIEQEKQRQLRLLHTRRALYSSVRTPIDAAGRVTIVVDDGIATGATMMAALHSTRTRHPGKLICATPVASPDALRRVEPLADTVVCLHMPADLHAVGEYYGDFNQVSDDEVIQHLSR